MIVCPTCRQPNPEEARYCMQCGRSVEFRLDIFALSLIGSLALTLILTLVFGLPVFILGAFLPFFWLRRKKP